MKLKRLYFFWPPESCSSAHPCRLMPKRPKARGWNPISERGTTNPIFPDTETTSLRRTKRLRGPKRLRCLCNLLLYPPETAESRFSDVTPGEWYADAVNSLSQIGIFNGYGDGTFRPGQNITRAEYVKALTSCVPAVEADNPFSDVKSTHWAYRNILTAISKQWINGYEDGTFRPDQTITRAEAVTILNRALKRTGAGFAEYRTGEYFTDIGKGHWAYLDIVEASGAVAYEEADLPGGHGRLCTCHCFLRAKPERRSGKRFWKYPGIVKPHGIIRVICAGQALDLCADKRGSKGLCAFRLHRGIPSQHGSG